MVEWITLIYWIASLVAAANFMYVWGWGDAAHADGIYHTGHADDEWHRKRRFAFYFIVFMALIANPLGLLVIGLFGRKLFRHGVKDASPEKHRRWYGNTED